MGVAVLLGLFLPGCFLHRHRKSELAAIVNPGDQPDKILYEKAGNEIEHNRFDVGRLTLQTLINTYPDSEYLSKAKLAIADSYYEQGGVSGFTQSEAEYRDFITFFPTAPEAPQAQYRIGMAHYRLMAKADRDQTEARLAEAELKEFLVKYPDNPLVIRVKARLRETQEVLAEGEFETASFYQFRGAFRAARGRYREIVEKYPNYSRGDEALFGLGQTLERLKTPKEALPYYAQLVRDFPLSPHVPDATQRLVAMGAPVPKPTRATLARAQADTTRLQPKGLLDKLAAAMAVGPDTSATLRGPVELGGAKATGVRNAQGLTPSSQPNATVVAEPVGEASLNSGKPADADAAGNGSGKNATTSAPASPANPTPSEGASPARESQTNSPGGPASPSSAQEGNPAPSSDKSSAKPAASTVSAQDPSAASTTSPKKKGKLHRLKKIVDPF